MTDFQAFLLFMFGVACVSSIAAMTICYIVARENK